MNNIMNTSQESQFLKNPKVKKVLQSTCISKHNEALLKDAEKTLDRTIALAKVVLNALNWWKADGQKIAKGMNLDWTQETFAIKGLGLSKAYMYELVKLANIESTIVDSFKVQAKKQREVLKEKVDMSYRSLIAYANKVAKDAKDEVKVDVVKAKDVKVKESKQSIASVPTLHIPVSEVQMSPTTSDNVLDSIADQMNEDKGIYLEVFNTERDRKQVRIITNDFVDITIHEDGTVEGKYTKETLEKVIESLLNALPLAK